MTFTLGTCKYNRSTDPNVPSELTVAAVAGSIRWSVISFSNILQRSRQDMITLSSQVQRNKRREGCPIHREIMKFMILYDRHHKVSPDHNSWRTTNFITSVYWTRMEGRRVFKTQYKHSARTSLTSSWAWGSFSFFDASSSLTRASLFLVNVCWACCQLLYERTRSWKHACRETICVLSSNASSTCTTVQPKRHCSMTEILHVDTKSPYLDSLNQADIIFQ